MNRTSINESLGRPLDVLCVQMSEGFVRREEQEPKSRLEKTVESLQRQRDQICSDISNYISCKKSDDDAQHLIDQIQKMFEEQLRSIQDDIRDANSKYNRLVAERDEIMNEMVLLNTKNAELNTINNDLTRRVSERERETMAFMAGTNFLDDKEKKPYIPKEEQPTLKKLKNRRLVFGRFGKQKDKIDSPTNDDTRSIDSRYDVMSSDEHGFYQTKFLRPVRCEVCGDKIWRTAELKCQGCGVTCHFKCASNMPNDCSNYKNSGRSPSMRSPSLRSPSIASRNSVVFGNDLIKQVQLENGKVPLIVRCCVEAVEARGMELEGIYRKSGGAKQMRQIQQLFDQGQIPNLADEKQWNDISAVTSVLKQYFRALPDPLFTFQFHDEFIKATGITNPNERLKEVQGIIHKLLPSENRDTIRYLMCHLYRVQKQHEMNYMNSRNLAVIFGPTLLRNPDETNDLLEMNRKIETIDYILNHCDELFGCCGNNQ
ncbi:Rho GTPase activation protein [Fennellomyces sp. T-0311]|nr:Rho GTPase activation protein [Fennellomyces sp. T-0311]